MTDAQRDAGEAAVIAAIGASVRRARRRSGLSTRELAQRASLSQPFLSNIENGRSTPSVATLYKLAAALGIGATDLLPASLDEGIVVVRAGEGVAAGVDETPGAAQSVLLAGAAGRMLEARRAVIEPGQPAGSWFDHGGEDFLHVLDGVVRVEFGTGRVEELRAGDSLWHDGAIPHRWRVGPDTGASLLLVTARIPGSEHD
ncbi:helix-turn-helix domain-containing protein [Pseudonocardia cypriaca]|uniref:XRE family transcriptional regulator n=1 Tax=Pseudonocardia cypriaca TaxID=882449 RepID=A0A543FW86_9PSEU|nr:helix-turn-helix domain-containing protein [Pseudonocardia cypriaca]TQM38108.1 XRE family transcriptional regulator [Pseudonocardia cypriaca]